MFKTLILDWENDIIDSYSDNLLNEEGKKLKMIEVMQKNFRNIKKYSNFLSVDDSLNESTNILKKGNHPPFTC